MYLYNVAVFNIIKIINTVNCRNPVYSDRMSVEKFVWIQLRILIAEIENFSKHSTKMSTLAHGKNTYHVFKDF